MDPGIPWKSKEKRLGKHVKSRQSQSNLRSGVTSLNGSGEFMEINF